MSLMALDIETTGLNPRKDVIHGIGWADDFGSGYCCISSDCSTIRKLLADPEQNIVGHNIRFDLKFLIQAGWDVRCKIWDTKVLAQLVDENQELGLKALTAKYFGGTSLTEKSEIDRAVSKAGVKHVGGLCSLDLETPGTYTDLISRYCIEDCKNTLALWRKLAEDAKRIDGHMKEFGFKKTILDYFIEEAMPIEMVLLRMELQGIAINTAALIKYRDKLQSENQYYENQMNELAQEEIAQVEELLYDLACSKRKSDKGKANVKKQSEKHHTKYNWQSADHIALLLSEGFGISATDCETTNTGKLSTSESSLEILREAATPGEKLATVLGIYAHWKKNLKLLNTYTGGSRGLLSQVEDGRVYAEYLQAGRGKEGTTGGTVTGRLSSRNPNMQNLPRDSEIKSFFVPNSGNVFIYFDYSQLELRLAAHLSQDPILMDAYKRNQDLHQITAEFIGKSRQIGKTTNFAMIYDASAWRLSAILNNTPEECHTIIRDFYDLYAGYKRYLQGQKAFMQKFGLVVAETGRVRRLPDVIKTHPQSKEFKHAVKQGYNFPIQGLGASLTKRAMIALDAAGYQLVTQVHDSVVIEVPAEQAAKEAVAIQRIAESVYPVSVPIKAEIKVLTSLLESDIIQTGGINEQSNSIS